MGRALAVFGAGVSGEAVAKLADSEGFDVDLYDENKNACLSDFNERIADRYDQFVFSPGFSKGHPWRKLLESKANVLSELGFSAQRWKGAIIGVTGTNGKTSLTRFLTFCLKKKGLPAYAVGNVGLPLSEIVSSDKNHEGAIAVCEISSFQAELLEGLRLDALLWTNFAEDHLDRYRTLEDYFQAKLGLVQTLSESGVFFVGEQIVSFKPKSFWLDQGALITEEEAMGLSDFVSDSVFASYPQRWNFSLAYSFLKWYGLEDSLIGSAARGFKLNAHRLQILCEREGLRIWEDSKATNLHAVLGALERFEKPLVWLGGGASKGESLAGYAKAILGYANVQQVILYGEVGSALAAEFLKAKPNINVHYSKDLGEAIREALKIVDSTVVEEVEFLFSPGFASFDQFASYAERGKYFSDTVFSLLEQNPPI